MKKPSSSTVGCFGLAIMLLAVVVMIAVSFVWAIEDAEDRQQKQNECLKAGGMYIDNKGTDPYCFFNK